MRMCLDCSTNSRRVRTYGDDMTEDEDKEDKKKDPFKDIFGTMDMDKEFEKMQKIAEEMMKRGLGDLEKNPFVYGFSVNMGSDGNPRIREFGNAKDHFSEEANRKEWTPLSDVQDCGNEILVTVDVPGVDKKDIELEVRERKLIIDVDGARRYNTEIKLPTHVEKGGSEATYRNGVLEVRLKKKKEEGEFIEIK